jgi:hypothetical protein
VQYAPLEARRRGAATKSSSLPGIAAEDNAVS